MTEDGGPDALSFTFVGIVAGKQEAHTMGMHVLGRPDIVMNVNDARADEFGIIDVIRYMASSDKPVGDGHIMCDLDGMRFRATTTSDRSPPGSLMHNPFGRLRLTSAKEIAESNCLRIAIWNFAVRQR